MRQIKMATYQLLGAR